MSPGGAPPWQGPERASDPAPDARGKDPELLPVLGYRAARDVQAVGAQQVRDLLVGERILRVLLRDQVLDPVARGARRNILAVVGGEPAGKEELELEDAARRLHVLAVG